MLITDATKRAMIYNHIKKSTYELQHYLDISHRADKRSGLTTCGRLVNVPVTLHRASRGIINARFARAKDLIHDRMARDTKSNIERARLGHDRVHSCHFVASPARARVCTSCRYTRTYARACATTRGTSLVEGLDFGTPAGV